MGFFDTIKRTLGMSQGEFEMRVQPDGCYVGGVVRGELELRAARDLEIVSVTLDLMHDFPDEDGVMHHDVHDGGALAERITMRTGERHAWPFFVELGPQLVPSAGRFAWRLRARANLNGGGAIEKEQAVQVRFSPIMEVIVALIQEQFGFTFKSIGADEESVWMEFLPGAAIKSYFRGLEIAYDEREDELLLWVALRDFRPSALRHFEDDYDPDDGSVELSLRRSSFMSGDHADREGLLQLLQPLFAL